MIEILQNMWLGFLGLHWGWHLVIGIIWIIILALIYDGSPSWAESIIDTRISKGYLNPITSFKVGLIEMGEDVPNLRILPRIALTIIGWIIWWVPFILIVFFSLRWTKILFFKKEL